MQIKRLSPTLHAVSTNGLHVYFSGANSFAYILWKCNMFSAGIYRPEKVDRSLRQHLAKFRKIVDNLGENLCEGVDEYSDYEVFTAKLTNALHLDSAVRYDLHEIPSADPPELPNPNLDMFIESLPNQDQQNIARMISQNHDVDSAWEKYPLVSYSVAVEISRKIRQVRA